MTIVIEGKKYFFSHWAQTQQSYYSDLFEEYFHSTSGAFFETYHNYVVKNSLLKKSEAGFFSHRPLSILEVGLGKGMGIYVVTEILSLLKNPPPKIIFFSLELMPQYEKLLEETLKALSPSNFYFHHLQKKVSFLKTVFQSPSLELTLLWGDARHCISSLFPTYNQSFDFIFFDAFSPQKNPTLWSPQFIQELSQGLKDDGILSTYSCSKIAKDAMKQAGLLTKKTQGLPPKREILLAGKTSYALSSSPFCPNLL